MVRKSVHESVQRKDTSLGRALCGAPDGQPQGLVPGGLLEADDEGKRIMERHLRRLMEIERSEGRARAKRPG